MAIFNFSIELSEEELADHISYIHPYGNFDTIGFIKQLDGIIGDWDFSREIIAFADELKQTLAEIEDEENG